ncbi:MAG: hypothetical protein KC454_03335 [Flavobacteriales bacterium]|nr:hypothetical protein [Flavobacteriales bacterium]
MLSKKTIIAYSVIFSGSICHCQSTDSATKNLSKATTNINNYFRQFSGGINAVYRNDKSKGGIDMAIQTYHYYMITGRREKSDSLHKKMVLQQTPVSKLYKGFHFFILNRAAINFDSIQAMTVDYFTSLKPSPLTLRIKKEFFLTKQHKLSPLNYIPVVSILLTGDGRTVPYTNLQSHTKAGVSGHFYLTFSTIFKRLEYDIKGNQIDHGTVYFRPSIGVAYGNKALMKTIQVREEKIPVMSTEVTLGFKSDKNSVKDFRFLLGYTINEIIGSKIRAGVVLSSL